MPGRRVRLRRVASSLAWAFPLILRYQTEDGGSGRAERTYGNPCVAYCFFGVARFAATAHTNAPIPSVVRFTKRKSDSSLRFIAIRTEKRVHQVRGKKAEGRGGRRKHSRSDSCLPASCKNETAFSPREGPWGSREE